MISIEGMNLNVDDWLAVLLLARPIVRHRDWFAQSDERGDRWSADGEQLVRSPRIEALSENLWRSSSVAYE
jgi:hypothetical protein